MAHLKAEVSTTEFSKKGENGHLGRDWGGNPCSEQPTALMMKIYGVRLAFNIPRLRLDSASYLLGDPGLEFRHL